MYAENFEYDGELLSEYGYIIVDFNGSDSFQTISIGSELQFEQKPANKGLRYHNTGYSYNGTATLPPFGIAKNPDVYKGNNRYFTDDETRHLIRWLQRPTLNSFRIIYDDEDREPCYFNATFNVQFVRHREKTIGFQLEMISDSAFGYGMTQRFSYAWYGTQTRSIPYITDVIGSCYPTVEIEILEAGTFTLRNELTGTFTQIKNCSYGEKIKFHGENCIITSDKTSHNLAKDFNFDFPKLANYYDNFINKITINIDCNVTIKYNPMIINLP